MEEADLARVEKRLRAINAFAPVVRSHKSNVSVDHVLGLRAFDLQRTLDMDPAFLDTDGEHEHDASVGSVSITLDGDVHLMLMNEWIGEVLQTKGNDIYRMKGVLSVAGVGSKFVYQGVHMIFDGEFEGRWEPGEKRGNKLVFIGKNLDKAELEAAFAACLATPANARRIAEVEAVKGRERAQNQLMGAAHRDDVVAMAGFLAQGADVNGANGVGQTPLHIACLWGNASAATWLLGKGADPNKKNQLGDQTAVHMLALKLEKNFNGRLLCANALVAAGADLNAENVEGVKPFQLFDGNESAAELRALLMPK